MNKNRRKRARISQKWARIGDNEQQLVKISENGPKIPTMIKDEQQWTKVSNNKQKIAKKARMSKN